MSALTTVGIQAKSGDDTYSGEYQSCNPSLYASSTDALTRMLVPDTCHSIASVGGTPDSDNILSRAQPGMHKLGAKGKRAGTKIQLLRVQISQGVDVHILDTRTTEILAIICTYRDGSLTLRGGWELAHRLVDWEQGQIDDGAGVV